MKKLLILLLVLSVFSVFGRAEEQEGAYFHFWNIDFMYPIANVTASPWLWDFINSRASMAIETDFACFPRKNTDIKIIGNVYTLPQGFFNFRYGAQTSEQARFTPIASMGCDFGKIITNAPSALTNFGVWIGHDFREENPRGCRVITDAGIKASIPIW